MTSTQRPAGPGRPIQERRDAASEREELEELPGDTPTGSAQPPADEQAQTATRHAERDSHTRTTGKDANSPSRPR